ncbi:oxygenase [Lithospermum erythrorhizon]|uniref:Squalene monooxygenase n=1 Tax=Lithospermum erythrorhizon TaxID=34254 RepID=A0AAV3NIT2_LITER
MRKKAMSLPSVELKQGMVTSLEIESGVVKGINYKGDERTILAPLTIVCDGSFSGLRGLINLPKVTKHGHCVGLLLKNCQAMDPGYVYALLDQRVGIYPIGMGEYRVLIGFPGKVPSTSNGDMAHFLKTSIAPEIPPELYGAFMAAVEEGQVKVAPMHSMPAVPCSSTPGAILLGDALNVRHPASGNRRRHERGYE